MTRWPARLASPVFPADTQALAFWLSRARLRESVTPSDLRQLARDVRRTWPSDPQPTGAQESANETGRLDSAVCMHASIVGPDGVAGGIDTRPQLWWRNND